MQQPQLSLDDHQKINRLMLNFGKTESNILKFSQLTMLLFDHQIFSNRFSYDKYLQIFKQSLSIKNEKDLGKDHIMFQKIIGREQFVFILLSIGKVYYGVDWKYKDKFFGEYLVDKVQIVDGELIHHRSPNFDQINRKLLAEQSLEILTQYKDELKYIYINYMIENYFSFKKSRRLLLSQREIVLQNKKWPYTSTILFLKQSETTPQLITVDHLEEIVKQVTPHICNKQHQFYYKHIFLDGFLKEVEVLENLTHYGDPGMYFHQFMLFLGRIAWETYPRELQHKNAKDVIQRYFTYLNIRKNQDIKKISLPNISRKMIQRMKQYYHYQHQQQYQAYEIKKIQDDLSPFQILKKQQNSQIMNATIHLDLDAIYKALDKQLPQIPSIPTIIQQQPPPYNKKNAITIGRQPPKQPKQKQKNPKMQIKKKTNLKKNQKPPRVFVWSQPKQTKIAIEDHLKLVENKLSFQVKPLSHLHRGVIPQEGYPVIIGETLFPHELPKALLPYITQSYNALNQRNFIVALQSYENAFRVWKQSQIEMDPVIELFFDYSRGSLYLSAGKLQHALQMFYNCRKYSDINRLTFNNLDRSLPYFGLGQVFYQMQEYKFAARAFLKAREIRQSIVGVEHVQTATVFNNLACCFLMLQRSEQALGYIEIAEVILDTQMGQHHQKTMICRSNYKKICNGKFDNKPQYRKFWQVFQNDMYGKKKVRKESKKKK